MSFPVRTRGGKPSGRATIPGKDGVFSLGIPAAFGAVGYSGRPDNL